MALRETAAQKRQNICKAELHLDSSTFTFKHCEQHRHLLLLVHTTNYRRLSSEALLC